MSNLSQSIRRRTITLEEIKKKDILEYNYKLKITLNNFQKSIPSTSK
jgi:hypothetical protein